MSIASRLLVVCGLVAGAAFSQDTRARVQGVVTDSSGAVVVHCLVTLINSETGTQASQVTNNTGGYLFDLVLPGTYTVTVKLAGFRTFVQKNVLVQTRGDVTVDARLDIGNANETVTVEA